VGTAQIKEVTKLFGWGNEIVKRTVGKLTEQGKLIKAEHPNQTGEWIAIKEVG
jgi:transposase